MAYRSIRTNVRLVALISFILIIWGTFLPIQVNLHVHAQSATISPTAIHTGDTWKGTESDLPGASVTLKITSIASGQSDPIRGTWEWNNNPGSDPTIFGGSEETYTQAYPGSLTNVIKIWGKSPIDRYITFKMTGTISGYIVEEANGDFKGIDISIMGQESWTKFVLNKVTSEKLFVLIQGINTELSNDQINKGELPGFDQNDEIASYLKNHSYRTAHYIMYSYNGLDSNGKLRSYGKLDTFMHSIREDEFTLDSEIKGYLNNHPGTNVYIIGHSLGGVIAFGYLGFLRAFNFSLPNKGKLRGIITLDSPLGGVPKNELNIVNKKNAIFGNLCPSLLCISVQNLESIFNTAPFTHPQGSNVSIKKILFGGTILSNQKLAEQAQASGIKILTIGNLFDFLYQPCGLRQYLSSQWVKDDGNTSGVYGRLIALPLSECNILNLLFNHGIVLSDKSVEAALIELINGGTPTALKVAPPL